MTELTDFERALVARMKAGVDAPAADAFDRLIARVDATGQRQASLIPGLRHGRRPIQVVRYAPVLLAAALALIVVGASALFIANQVSPRPVPPAPSLPTSPSPQPTSSLNSGVPPSTTYIDWASAPISSPRPTTTAFVQALASFADGYVAAGTEYVSEGPAIDADAAVWLSADGTAWTAVETQPAFEGGSILDMAATDDLVVAVGFRFTEVRAGPQETVPVVWWSRDARSWQRVDAVPPFEKIAALADGFVAATRDPSDDTSQIWTSNDGVAWEQVAAEADLDNGSVMRLRVLADGTSGLTGDIPAVVAVGSNGNQPAVWVSSAEDLLTWRQAIHIGTLGLSFIDDIAAGRDGIVAVGTVQCCRFGGIRSGDGLEWRPVNAAISREKATAVTSIVATPEGFAAFGARGAGWDSGGRLAAWTSRDGAEWSVIETDALDGAGDLQFGDTILRPDGALLVVANTFSEVTGLSPHAWVVRP